MTLKLIKKYSNSTFIKVFLKTKKIIESMGLFNAILGNASEVSLEQVEKEFEPILIEGEKIEKAYKMVKDMFIFSNKRLILVEKQLVGSKVDYLSIPYNHVIKFSKESAGILDLDAELKIWIKDEASPIIKQFGKGGNNINEVYKILSKHILK
jgi:Bacterial PH domain